MGNFYSRIKRLFGGGGAQTSRPTPRASDHVRVGYHDLYELLTRYEHMESLYRMNKLDSSELSVEEICTTAAKRVVHGIPDPDQAMMHILEAVIPAIKEAMIERKLLKLETIPMSYTSRSYDRETKKEEGLTHAWPMHMHDMYGNTQLEDPFYGEKRYLPDLPDHVKQQLINTVINPVPPIIIKKDNEK